MSGRGGGGRQNKDREAWIPVTLVCGMILLYFYYFSSTLCYSAQFSASQMDGAVLRRFIWTAESCPRVKEFLFPYLKNFPLLG